MSHICLRALPPILITPLSRHCLVAPAGASDIPILNFAETFLTLRLCLSLCFVPRFSLCSPQPQLWELLLKPEGNQRDWAADGVNPAQGWGCPTPTPVLPKQALPRTKRSARRHQPPSLPIQQGLNSSSVKTPHPSTPGSNPVFGFLNVRLITRKL